MSTRPSQGQAISTNGVGARPRSGRRPALFGLLIVLCLAAAGGWWWSAQAAAKMHERQGLQLGTFISLRAAGRTAPDALDAAMAEINRLEALFSYSVATSDVARLNAAAGQGRVQLAPETITVLVAAQRMAEISQGRFDVTIAPLVDLWGFRPDVVQSVPAASEIVEALKLVDYRQLAVYPASNEAELLRAGMRVDLGAIAKGYVVDRVAAVLREHGVVSAVLDVGGNVYALGLRPEGSAWRVGLQHPRTTDQLLGVLPMTDRSVATSGDYQRFFVVGEDRYHHLLDPTTGYPSAGIASISIVAPTGLEADAVSTAAFVLGREAGMALVRSLGLEAVMYTEDGQLELTGGLQALFEAPR